MPLLGQIITSAVSFGHVIFLVVGYNLYQLVKWKKVILVLNKCCSDEELAYDSVISDEACFVLV
jgi:hypothetical protein